MLVNIGELSESLPFKEITWKISKDHILPNSADYDVESPSFQFADATWTLWISPYGLTESNSIGWIDLGVKRYHSKIPEHDVFCKFYFKTCEGKAFEPVQASYTFNANFSFSSKPYIEKDAFLLKEATLAKEDVFTIICQMRIQKNNEIEESSATELVEPIVGCDSISQHPVTLSGIKTLILNFKELFLKKEDCDVIIKVKGQEFPAHTTILKARSPVFASTFRNDMKERATGIVEIEDCDSSSFSDFLCFLYCGSVENLSTGNVFSLFTAADKYDVQDLRSECVGFMKENLSVDTFCDITILALQHSEKELIELTANFFGKNLKKIIVTAKWQSFLIENPIQGNELLIKALVPNAK